MFASVSLRSLRHRVLRGIFSLLAAFLCLSATMQLHAAESLSEIQQLLRQGHHAQALDKVNAYLGSRPKDAQGRFLKGLILTELKHNNEAIAVFTQLTEEYPLLPEPYNNLAVLYAQQKQYDRARNALEMAIRTHPSYAIAYENLGDVYAKLASQAYDKALQLDISNAAAQSKLALIRDLVSSPAAVPPRTQTMAQAQTPQTPQTQPVLPPVVSVQPVAPAQTTTQTTNTTPAAPASSTPSKKPVPEVVDKPVADKPIADKPAADKPAADKPAVDKPAVDKPVADKPAVGKPVAEKPVDAKSNGTKPDRDSDAAAEVTKTIAAWASAWSQQNVKAYLEFYAPAFKTPKGMGRKEWEEERKARITSPAWIKVSYNAPDIRIDGDRATARFRQQFQSPTFKSGANKTLTFIRSGRSWLILSEESN